MALLKKNQGLIKADIGCVCNKLRLKKKYNVFSCETFCGVFYDTPASHVPICGNDDHYFFLLRFLKISFFTLFKVSS